MLHPPDEILNENHHDVKTFLQKTWPTTSKAFSMDQFRHFRATQRQRMEMIREPSDAVLAKLELLTLNNSVAHYMTLLDTL